MRPPLHIHNLALSPAGDEVSACWEFDNRPWRVYFRSRDVPLRPSVEGMVSATLLTAMKGRVSTLSAEAPASPRFLANLERIQHFFHDVRPHYRLVNIAIPPRPELPPTQGRVGAFFSAGLDSYYTVLKHLDEITDLIYIHGLDIPLSQVEQRQHKSAILRQIAAALNKRLIEVETNVVGFNHQYLPLHMLTSSILTSVGHQLSGELRRIYIAAPDTADHIVFNGSHPDLDPLWGTETLEFVHDGLEATRVDKARRVAESEIALQTLHVCLERRQGTYNCGRCEKCLRTMINLRLVGALERCHSFSEPLDLQRVRRLKPLNSTQAIYLQQNIAYLERTGQDPALLEALLQARKVTWWKKLRRQIERWRFRGAGKRRYRDTPL